jgi:perosamine synthetase
LDETVTQPIGAMNIPFGRPMLGDEERAAVMKVMSGSQLVHGPAAKQFEADFQKFVGGGYATSMSSCTTALHLAYVHLGIGPGDEVVVPAQTHVATAHAVAYTGATPVFVDCDPDTGNVSAARIAERLSPRTKAISVVHYLGLPVDMGPVLKLARSRNLFVVEDAALSLGATYDGTNTGLIGDVGCFSFYPVKHITTAEGGMFLTRHEDLAKKIERMKSFGYDKQVGQRPVPGHYDVNLLGYNYRLSEIACAIGVEQMRKLPGFLARRAENYAALKSGLGNMEEISILASDGDAIRRGSHYCLTIVLSDQMAGRRGEIIAAINRRGVGTSIYYPVPVPLTTLYRKRDGNAAQGFPNAARISTQSIALPVGPHLGRDETKTVIQAVKAAVLEN